MKNSLILFILIISAVCYAELPITLPDQKTRQVVEYIDAKVSKANQDISNGNGWEKIANDCGSAASCTATCSTGKKIVGGGCNHAVNVYVRSQPTDANNGWFCQISNTQQLTAYAICITAK